MSASITFLHTADLHLGAPMRGFRDLTPTWAERLQRAIPQAFDSVIETALSRKVDFVVMAGDMFDNSNASYCDYLQFFQALRHLDEAGIPVYLTTGNHDPYSTWKHDLDLLPPSCHLMGGEAPEFALYERDGKPLCLVGARGYRYQAWPAGDPIASGIDRQHAVKALLPANPQAGDAPFSIGVIHTCLDADQSKACSDPAELLAADVDYWACGHLHKRQVETDGLWPRIVFPGCIQGRDLKESGERGCYLVSLSEPVSPGARARVDLEFVPTASVVFHTVHVDVSACQTLADVAHLIQASLFHENGKAGCDEMVERIVLEGSTSLHGYLATPDVLRDLRKRVNNAFPSFYCDALVDQTKPARNRRTITREGLFEAYVLGVADEQRRESAQMINYVQSEFVKRGIDVPASLAPRIQDFEDEAETLVMDLLVKERL